MPPHTGPVPRPAPAAPPRAPAWTAGSAARAGEPPAPETMSPRGCPRQAARLPAYAPEPQDRWFARNTPSPLEYPHAPGCWEVWSLRPAATLGGRDDVRSARTAGSPGTPGVVGALL